MKKKKRYLSIPLFWTVAWILLFIGFLSTAIVLLIRAKSVYSYHTLFFPIFFGLCAIGMGICLLLLQWIVIIDEKGVFIKGIVKKWHRQMTWDEIVEIEVLGFLIIRPLYIYNTEMSALEKRIIKNRRKDKRVLMTFSSGKRIRNAIKQYYHNEIKVSKYFKIREDKNKN